MRTRQILRCRVKATLQRPQTNKILPQTMMDTKSTGASYHFDKV